MFNWVVNRPLKIMKFSRSEAVTQSCSVKKVFLEIRKVHSKTLLPESLSKSLSKKGTLTQLFSCEFCKICKYTLSYRTPPVAASTR